jgi:hypothetical protein
MSAISPISAATFQTSQAVSTLKEVQQYLNREENLDHFCYNLEQLLLDLGASAFLQPFNYSEPDWQNRVTNYLQHPESLKSADLKTLSKLYLTHMRTERFCEGHLKSLIHNGHFSAFVERLAMLVV